MHFSHVTVTRSGKGRENNKVLSLDLKALFCLPALLNFLLVLPVGGRTTAEQDSSTEEHSQFANNS